MSLQMDFFLKEREKLCSQQLILSRIRKEQACLEISVLELPLAEKEGGVLEKFWN